MFAQKYDSLNRKFSMYITIKCVQEKKFRVWAEEFQKRNSKYADREITVKGERTIHFNFPVSPQMLFFGVLNSENPQDSDFSVDLKEETLQTYNIWIDGQTTDFLSLAVPFCQVSGFSQASPQGRVFQTSDKEFTIKYFDIIKDYKTGKAMNTPARIGHKTGIIETAKVKFDGYTIPMRLIILLHEYSHKYKNPKIGLEISNEVGADVNALYIYLGLGFSKIDAICVFANVFLKAQTKGNIERMRKIMDYIQKFENQEFAKSN
jgi:hypothetical protein